MACALANTVILYYSIHNDITMTSSPLPSTQGKKTYEKIGEATEVALTVLVEKVNVAALDRGTLTPQQKACACNNTVLEEFEKVESGSFIHFCHLYLCVCVSLIP